MATLIPVSDLIRDRNYDLGGNDHYDFIGKRAYASNGEHVGTVREALTEEGGNIRYFVVEVGNWFTSKEVVIPVGMARIEDDGVYFDSLTKDQVKGMNEYVYGQDYGYDAQVADVKTLRGTDYVAPTTTAATSTDLYKDESLFSAPTKLQLLEERLLVNKDRYVAGSVQVGKKVETHTENVNVDLSHEEVVIHRTPVTDGRPVDGNVTLGEASQTIRVDLEAERANVSKQAYVTEEVEIGKRTETQQQTFSDTVGKEVLDVTKTGAVQVTGDGSTTTTTTTTDELDDNGTTRVLRDTDNI
ncbi:PRC and DUF2382 domain-containing protein [Deinococcus ruber]|uniref:Photosystem reaction center subunit H n=1 Tax=Deinococcus ruber TaxID=1848197 RepID=A0A918CFM4_9DEIO|nr:DUF2382 domain-containing protein [Deinococcus ruber]GGR18902.1 hypothetical protein GCM10008957_34450 [Deinococcus ruber]